MITSVLMAWSNIVFAADLVVKVPVKEYEQTKEQIEQLKKQVLDLEEIVGISLDFFLPGIDCYFNLFSREQRVFI